jgi:uncharacterized protein (TIGR04255 family)
MSATTGRLPEFENPPVSEVALSVAFSPLPQWQSPHAGLYWGRIRSRYPHTEVHPPIPSQIEQFGDQFWQTPMVSFQIAEADIARTWFLAEPKTHIIQVQRDRFITNWRKVEGTETYPRYLKEVRPRFVKEWNEFKEFAAEQNVGEISVQQCEITYINDIIQGEGWSDFREALELFSPQWPRKQLANRRPLSILSRESWNAVPRSRLIGPLLGCVRCSIGRSRKIGSWPRRLRGWKPRQRSGRATECSVTTKLAGSGKRAVGPLFKLPSSDRPTA